jgi:hypothetical protein
MGLYGIGRRCIGSLDRHFGRNINDNCFTSHAKIKTFTCQIQIKQVSPLKIPEALAKIRLYPYDGPSPRSGTSAASGTAGSSYGAVQDCLLWTTATIKGVLKIDSSC